MSRNVEITKPRKFMMPVKGKPDEEVWYDVYTVLEVELWLRQIFSLKYLLPMLKGCKVTKQQVKLIQEKLSNELFGN